MRRLNILWILLVFSVGAYAQDTLKGAEKSRLEKRSYRYLEDQIYASFTYDLLLGKPAGVRTYSIPNTFSFGYLRDIPVNRRRNVGFAAGIAFGFHSYYQNMKMTKTAEGVSEFAIMDASQYKGNRFSMQTLEIPVQFRFRTSTAEKYKFWRFYAGFTPVWIYRNHTTFKQDDSRTRYYRLDYFRKWMYYVNLQVGYGSFNLRVDYSLTSMFKKSADAATGADLSGLRTLNLGLIYYIL